MADTYTLAEDGTLNVPAPGVLWNDTDPDGDPLTAQLLSGPSHVNQFVFNPDGSFTYAPIAHYAGPDSFSYTVSDGNGGSASATVSITVTPVNDAPVANSQTIIAAENTPVALVLTGSDVDSDTLTFTVVSGPSHGSLSGTVPNLTYTAGHAFFKVTFQWLAPGLGKFTRQQRRQFRFAWTIGQHDSHAIGSRFSNSGLRHR